MLQIAHEGERNRQAQEVDSLKIDTQIFKQVFDSRSHSSQYALRHK
jgi:hypothetical protein